MMKKDQNQEFYCDLSALSGNDRREHITRTKTLFAGPQSSINWLPEALEISIEKEVGSLLALTQWAHDESRCCPFLEFQMTIPPSGGQISLRVYGPAGAVDFLREESRAISLSPADTERCCAETGSTPES
jgi:hypothetical protein